MKYLRPSGPSTGKERGPLWKFLSRFTPTGTTFCNVYIWIKWWPARTFNSNVSRVNRPTDDCWRVTCPGSHGQAAMEAHFHQCDENIKSLWVIIIKNLLNIITCCLNMTYYLKIRTLYILTLRNFSFFDNKTLFWDITSLFPEGFTELFLTIVAQHRATDLE